MKSLQIKLLSFCLAFISFFFISLAFAQDIRLSELSANLPTAKRIATVERLLSMGPEAIPLLRQGLEHFDETVRIESIRLLGEVKAKEAVPSLIQYLKTVDTTRSVLVTTYALGQIQDKRATPLLLQTASSLTRNNTRRRGAIIALGLLGDTKAIPVLEKILADSDELLRVFAAGSLGLLDSDKGLSIALQAVESSNSSVRLHAIQALGLIGSNKALDTLNDMLMLKPSVVERQTIEMALFQISLQGLPVEGRISAIERKLLSISKMTALSRWCIYELHRLGSPTAKASLQKVIQNHTDERIRSQATRKRKALDISLGIKEENTNAK